MNFAAYDFSGNFYGGYDFCGNSFGFTNCSDPYIKFDRINGLNRWIVSYLVYSPGSSSASAIVLGVSIDSSFFDGFFRYELFYNSSNTLDFPKIGVTIDKLLLTTRLCPGSFCSGQSNVTVADISAVTSGGAYIPYANFVVSQDEVSPASEDAYSYGIVTSDEPGGGTVGPGQLAEWVVTGTNGGGDLTLYGPALFSVPTLQYDNQFTPGYVGSSAPPTLDTDAPFPYMTIGFPPSGIPLLWATSNNSCYLGDSGSFGGYEACTAVMSFNP